MSTGIDIKCTNIGFCMQNGLVRGASTTEGGETGWSDTVPSPSLTSETSQQHASASGMLQSTEMYCDEFDVPLSLVP